MVLLKISEQDTPIRIRNSLLPEKCGNFVCVIAHFTITVRTTRILLQSQVAD